MADILNITILEDGTIKAETDKISPANHVSADMFFKLLQKDCGGAKDVKARSGHVHTHEGITHSH
jgi:hypothetical protein